MPGTVRVADAKFLSGPAKVKFVGQGDEMLESLEVQGLLACGMRFTPIFIPSRAAGQPLSI